MFIRATRFGKEGLGLARTWVESATQNRSLLPPRDRLWPVLSVPSLGDEEKEGIIDVPLGILTGQMVNKEQTGSALVMLRHRQKGKDGETGTLESTGIALIVLATPDIATSVIGELYAVKKKVL